nr:hypothetical protein [Caproiciproducens galactitolivorans]
MNLFWFFTNTIPPAIKVPTAHRIHTKKHFDDGICAYIVICLKKFIKTYKGFASNIGSTFCGIISRGYIIGVEYIQIVSRTPYRYCISRKNTCRVDKIKETPAQNIRTHTRTNGISKSPIQMGTPIKQPKMI